MNLFPSILGSCSWKLRWIWLNSHIKSIRSWRNSIPRPSNQSYNIQWHKYLRDPKKNLCLLVMTSAFIRRKPWNGWSLLVYNQNWSTQGHSNVLMVRHTKKALPPALHCSKTKNFKNDSKLPAFQMSKSENNSSITRGRSILVPWHLFLLQRFDWRSHQLGQTFRCVQSKRCFTPLYMAKWAIPT